MLALTGLAMSGDEANALEVGCDAYLSKPYQHQELLGAVKRLIG